MAGRRPRHVADRGNTEGDRSPHARVKIRRGGRATGQGTQDSRRREVARRAKPAFADATAGLPRAAGVRFAVRTIWLSSEPPPGRPALRRATDVFPSQPRGELQAVKERQTAEEAEAAIDQPPVKRDAPDWPA